MLLFVKLVKKGYNMGKRNFGEDSSQRVLRRKNASFLQMHSSFFITSLFDKAKGKKPQSFLRFFCFIFQFV